MSQINYKLVKRGWLHGLITKDRFRLTDDLCIQTRITGYSGTAGHVTISVSGALVIRKGYTWDGASGPTWDTACTIRASCVHDGLYQLISAKVLPKSARWRADGELWRIMREDGAPWWRALYYLGAVNAFGGLCLK